MGASPAAIPGAMPHNQMLYCVVALDEELWRDQIEFLRSMNVRSFREPDGFEFQWDGQVHGPIKPGEKVTLPYAAAQAGIQKSAVFPRQQDEGGNEMMALDHMGARTPMLKIVDTFDPMRRGIEDVVKKESASEAEQIIKRKDQEVASLRQSLETISKQMREQALLLAELRADREKKEAAVTEGQEKQAVQAESKPADNKAKGKK